MITKQNYFDQVDSIDYGSLPEALKDSFDTLKHGSKDYTTWEYLEDDPEFLNLYFSKLNIFLGKESYEKEHHISTQEKKGTSKNKKVESKKSQEKPKPTRKKSTPKPKKETETKSEQIDHPKSEEVEHFSEEVRFIRRYVALHNRVKTNAQILSLLNSLQKAIVEKRIRKTSHYAKEIIHIQKNLIKLYNRIKDTHKIVIEKTILEKYKLISSSEHILTSINFIKRYLSLHGKSDVKKQAALLMKQLKEASEKNKILITDPYANAISTMYQSLVDYIELKKTQTVEVHPATLNGFESLLPFATAVLGKKKIGAHIKNDIDFNLKGNKDKHPEVISSKKLSEMKFETIGLKGKFYKLIGDPSVGFTCMIYGKPASGKSTLSIDFAKHLAEHHGKVLFSAIEEGYGYTLKEKIERRNAVHPNLFVSESIPIDVGSYNFVFIDSVSKAKIDNEILNDLHAKYPKTAFISVYHSTKNGDFRGGQQNAHDADCIIEVKDGVAYGKGRFGVGGECNVFE